jgi:hypothetical protein
MEKPLRILVVPDTQVREGVPLEHLSWAGEAICDYRPDVVVMLGDWADMPSLSTHDSKGSKSFEGLRYQTDVGVAKEAMQKMLKPLRDLQAQQKKNKERVYKPRMELLGGNHDQGRIERAINSNPHLEGLISVKDLEYEKDWNYNPFLRPLFINNVGFNHYWPSGAKGLPVGSASALLSKLHMSVVAGHQQGKQIAYSRRADGGNICGIITGSFYLHDEHYMDPLSNRHWRGLVVLNEVLDGQFDEMFLSIDYLKRRYG